jgi:alpha-D-xyloside xylohydrolase
LYSLDQSGTSVTFRHGGTVVKITALGADTARVQCSRHHVDDRATSALDEPTPSRLDVTSCGERLDARNGLLRVTGTTTGRLSFHNAETGAELLSEASPHFRYPGPRHFVPSGAGRYKIEQRFGAQDGEQLFGLGQRTHGRLNHKGMVLDLVQRNAEISIPFMLSNRGYGFLWNSAAVGHVEFLDAGTRWVSDSARQIDYVVFAGDGPQAVLQRYADATGHAPLLPEWASGFWQSKLRYRTQQELLDVVREHRDRGLPMSVVVADFYHWTRTGDYGFDLEEFPDPRAMVEELDSYGIKLMVSIWPLVNPASPNYVEMKDRSFLIERESGYPYLIDWWDKGMPHRSPVAIYDPSNPEAREFVWSKVSENYKSLGIKVWWLDACEPQMRPEDPWNMHLSAGPGTEVLNAYPQLHARGFYEGMQGEGEDEVVLLCRSAWAGAQRYGAAVWSGDIETTFDSLARQIRAGISIAISGIPWWTTDIGGFHGGDPDSPDYRELMIRWFQFGVFCPLFRLHGHREPRGSLSGSTAREDALGPLGFGGHNEVWAYGDEAYEIIRDQLLLRERLRPYVMDVMRETAETGVPPMRALFLNFPEDKRAWEIEDQFMLGGDILVAPITELGARVRSVYLPAGVRWRHVWSGKTYDGGATCDVESPLQEIPVFVTAASSLSLM